MVKTLSLRIVQALALALFVHTICFIMMQMLPGDQATQIAAGRYGADSLSIDIAESVSIELGLDKPIIEQYWNSLYHLLTLNLGHSLISGEKVIDAITVQLGYSIYLTAIAFCLSLIIAFPIGIFTGLYAHSKADKLGLLFSVFLKAIPPFVLGIMLILIFSIQFTLLPPAGYEDFTYMILPALTLALGLSAVSSRVIRESMSDVAQSSYFKYAKYKGLSNRVMIKQHGIKNTSIPILAFLALQSIYLIDGVVVVEAIFAFPGIGQALVEAIFSRDVPMIQGTVLVLGLLFVLINLFIDIISQYLDPRLKSKNA